MPDSCRHIIDHNFDGNHAVAERCIKGLFTTFAKSWNVSFRKCIFEKRNLKEIKFQVLLQVRLPMPMKEQRKRIMVVFMIIKWCNMYWKVYMIGHKSAYLSLKTSESPQILCSVLCRQRIPDRATRFRYKLSSSSFAYLYRRLGRGWELVVFMQQVAEFSPVLPLVSFCPMYLTVKSVLKVIMLRLVMISYFQVESHTTLTIKKLNATSIPSIC